MTVHVVDDDKSIRSSLTWALQSTGLQVCAHETPQEFLDRYEPALPACLILDLRLNEADGVNFLRELRTTRDMQLPVIIVTGTADVPKVIQCMKLRAMDFFEKPVAPAALSEVVQRGLAMDQKRLEKEKQERDIAHRFASLTPRDHEVMPLICSGLSTKQIALQLHRSVKTIKNHRSRLMKKVGANNAAHLVHLSAMHSQLSPQKPA